ncbi:GNAT family N-acetyltransferase [bacterium]|jgi:RimJ/RimL family protein N-acetyltransferase|nr:GNAT family N-acetyltransferase [bacterium]
MNGTLLASAPVAAPGRVREPAAPAFDGAGLLKTGAIELGDGLRVWFRPIRPDDAVRLQEFHQRLSPESQRMRFFSPMRELSGGLARRLTRLDFQRRVAVVVCLPGDDAIRGVARYELVRDGGPAEIAFVMEDDLQGRGVGKIMLHLLARYARYMGITHLVADVLPENQHMLAMFERCDFPRSAVWAAESVTVTLDISRGSCDKHMLAG